jgi:hypothetical protein
VEQIRQECLSPGATLRSLVRDPISTLVHGWNWKSAIFSTLCRSAVFFFANLSSGFEAATGALITEFLYRSISAGFYGAMTQAFRKSEPRWAATLVVLIGVPGVSHAIEFLLHWVRGTPNLRTSIIASLILTLISTSFNLHAMRRGVLVVGQGEQSLGADMRSLPATIWTFITSGFGFARLSARSPGWS